MQLHGVVADAQRVGDGLVAQSPRHVAEDLPFADRQLPQRGVALLLLLVVLQQARELGGHRRGYDEFAARGPHDRVDDLLGRQVLEQVGANAHAQRVRQVFARVAHRQDHHRDVEPVVLERLHEPQPVDRRHAQVRDHQVRPVRLDQRQRLAGVAGGRDDLHAGAQLEQLAQAPPAQRVVVDQQYAQRFSHGRPLRTPRPGAGSAERGCRRRAGTRWRCRRRSRTRGPA